MGRPCAGCVGKADYKNPPGQMPNGAQDGNRGYECDNNQGIGKTNPAHTGCKTGVAPPTDTNKPPVVKQPPTTGPPQGKPPVEQPPKVVPDIEVRPSVPDKVLPLPRIEREVVRPAAELQPVPLQVSPAGVAPLPFTGSADPWLFLIFGFGLIGAGWMTLLSLPIRSRKMRFI